MKPNFFLFKRNGKEPLKRLDRTIFRLITNGPNREALIIDSLRLGIDVDYLGVVFLESFYKQTIRNVPIVSVGRLYGNDSWIIEFQVGKRVFEAFYSTKTRCGYVCDTKKVKKQIWPNGDIYRPLTDYELLGLLALVDIVDSETFLKHILSRIIQSLKGIKDYHDYQEKNFEGESKDVVEKIQNLKKLVFRNRQRNKSRALIAEFREILG